MKGVRRFSLLLVVILLVSCNQIDRSPNRADMTTASSILGIDFPESAKGILFRHVEGLDDMLWIKLSIHRSDLSNLLKNSPFVNCELNNTEKFAPRSGNAKWDVSDIKRFRSAQLVLPNGSVIEVLIDDDQIAHAIVYLFWTET